MKYLNIEKNDRERRNSDIKNSYIYKMAQPISDLGKFGAKMDELFTVLRKAFPEDIDLQHYDDKLKAARKINPRKVCEKFMEIVEQPVPGTQELFLHKIMREDDGFFLGLNHTDFVGDSTYLQLINKVTVLWVNMSQSSQSAIKRYMQILCMRGAQVTKSQVALLIINQHRSAIGQSSL